MITENYPQSFQYILDSKADALALNFQVGNAMVAKSLLRQDNCTGEDVHRAPAGCRSDQGQHKNLLKQLDAGLAAIRARYGTLQRINDKVEPIAVAWSSLSE